MATNPPTAPERSPSASDNTASSTMRAFCLEGDALAPREIPIPQPAANELLIRVHATAVTSAELAWYPTTHTVDGAARFHAVPGHEFSGEVVAAGDAVRDFHAGDAVFGMNDWFAEGATAEYCVVSAAGLATKPETVSHADAASVPISALTAWQGLFDRAQLRAGERVLVHGGAGGVGVFALQLARWVGAYVITTASERHTEALRELGADEVIDYHVGAFEERVGKVDVVFDGVGGETLQRSWGVLKPGGRMVTVATDGETAQDERTKAAFFIVEQNRSQLAEIAGLLSAGRLRPVVATVIPFVQAAAAYAGAGVREKRLGKVVIAVRPPAGLPTEQATGASSRGA